MQSTLPTLTEVMTELQRLSPSLAQTARITEEGAELRDSSPELRAAPSLITYPHSVEEVQLLVRLAAERRLPITPRGARTGLVGGAAPLAPSVVIDTSQMRRVLELDLAGKYLRVEPGVLLGEIEELLAPHGMMYPPDPASYRRASIGGTVATNAGGLRCVKYGVTANWVRTLDVVLPNGELARLGHRVIKDATGLNLTQLFVGSEGTLGVIVGVGVSFCRLPEQQQLAVFGFPSIGSAMEGVLETLSLFTPGMCELVDAEALRHRDTSPLSGLLGDFEEWGDDPTLIIAQVEGPSASADLTQLIGACGTRASVHAVVPHELVAGVLDVRRGVSSQARGGDETRVEESLAQAASDRETLPQDLSVPLPALSGVVQQLRGVTLAHHVESRIVAHVGDGNIHLLLVGTNTSVNGTADAQRLEAAMHEIIECVLAVGGTISGEHGVGSLKQAWAELDLGPTVSQLQRSIKASIDPLGIMNPGKLYSTA